MKRILILYSFLSFTFSSNAQTKNPIASRQGLWIRPELALGGGTVVGSNISVDGTSRTPMSENFSIQISGGADIGYMFNDKVGIFTGIGIGGYGAHFSYGNYIGEIDMTNSTVYMEIPVFFQFISSHAGHSGFFFNVGFKNGFLVGCTTEVKVQEYGYPDQTHTIEGNDENFYNNYSFSPFTYFGFNIRCGSNVDIDLGPEVTLQATSLFNDSNKNIDGSTWDGHYLNFALKMGVNIHCIK